jgi:RNA polymerase sigma-70 factor (ECF subfamily)
MPEGAAEALVDDAPTPETRANDRGLTDMMARLIERLPPEQQAVLQLSYYQEMSVEQVAEVIGCPVNTVKTRMYYARQHLKKMLAAEGVAVLPV